jgi:anti-anti-sigma regulatory factor
MGFIKELSLLKAIEREYPEGIIKAESKNKRQLVTLTELGGKHFRSPEMIELLNRYWDTSDEDVLYIIDLSSIDILTPSAAKILVDSVPRFAAERKKPIVFKSVRPYVAEALNLAAITCEPPMPIWIESEDSKCKLIGKLPGRFETLMSKLEDAGCPCSASSIALKTSGEASKKTVNKLSVYLQEMVNLGLVGRIKENAGSVQNRERGWTYLYHRPDDKILAKLESIKQPQ